MSNITSLIESALMEHFSPQRLNIDNDSARHAGHAEAGDSGYSHFSVTIIADAFEGKSRVQRHRMVNDALKEAFAQGVHAVQIKALSPEEDQAA